MNKEHIFCAVFTVNNEQDQVLITKEYDDSDDNSPFSLCQRAEIFGINATVKYKYKEADDLDAAFSNYTQQNAEDFYSNCLQMISEN